MDDRTDQAQLDEHDLIELLKLLIRQYGIDCVRRYIDQFDPHRDAMRAAEGLK